MRSFYTANGSYTFAENVLYSFDKNTARKSFFIKTDEKAEYREWSEDNIHYLNESALATDQVTKWMNSLGRRANILHSHLGSEKMEIATPL